MKGIFPAPCRIAGYVLLAFSVFAPLLAYVFGMVDDGNLLYVKFGIKLSIWISLFLVFLSKAKDEDEEAALLRSKAMKYALYIWAAFYVVMLFRAVLVSHDMQSADNSAGIVYMVVNVLCLEFLFQKRRVERMFRKK